MHMPATATVDRVSPRTRKASSTVITGAALLTAPARDAPIREMERMSMSWPNIGLAIPAAANQAIAETDGPPPGHPRRSTLPTRKGARSAKFVNVITRIP